MPPSPVLEGKCAVVFGAGGSIGAAVAKEFAAEGAQVFLAGRTAEPVELVAKEITANGGSAHAQVVDALDANGPEVSMSSSTPSDHESASTGTASSRRSCRSRSS